MDQMVLELMGICLSLPEYWDCRPVLSVNSFAIVSHVSQADFEFSV